MAKELALKYGCNPNQEAGSHFQEGSYLLVFE